MPRGINNYDAGMIQGRNVANTNSVYVASPGLITDGLLINLDAGNFVSYPASGTNFFDLSEFANNASLVNGPTYSYDGVGSILFDGVNDYAATATQTGLGNTNRTVEVWFNIVTRIVIPNNRIVVLPGDDTVTDFPAMCITYSTVPEKINVGMGGAPYDAYLDIATPSLNTWYHVVGSVTGSTLSAYFNGQFISSATNTGPIGANPTLQLARYNGTNGQYGNTKIALARVYNRALTSAEVNQNFNATRARFGV